MSCRQCYKNYSYENIPKIFLCCGKSLCTLCLSQIQEGSPKVRCPYCDFVSQEENLPINYDLMNEIGTILNERQLLTPHFQTTFFDNVKPQESNRSFKMNPFSTYQPVRCPMHLSQIYEFRCVKCSVFVCSNCVALGNHIGHQCISMESHIEYCKGLVTEMKYSLILDILSLAEGMHAISAIIEQLTKTHGSALEINKWKSLSQTFDNLQDLMITLYNCSLDDLTDTENWCLNPCQLNVIEQHYDSFMKIKKSYESFVFDIRTSSGEIDWSRLYQASPMHLNINDDEFSHLFDELDLEIDLNKKRRSIEAIYFSMSEYSMEFPHDDLNDLIRLSDAMYICQVSTHYQDRITLSNLMIQAIPIFRKYGMVINHGKILWFAGRARDNPSSVHLYPVAPPLDQSLDWKVDPSPISISFDTNIQSDHRQNLVSKMFLHSLRLLSPDERYPDHGVEWIGFVDCRAVKDLLSIHEKELE